MNGSEDVNPQSEEDLDKESVEGKNFRKNYHECVKTVSSGSIECKDKDCSTERTKMVSVNCLSVKETGEFSGSIFGDKAKSKALEIKGDQEERVKRHF